MKNQKEVTRREFTVKSALAILSGVTITLTGCGDSGSTSPSPPPSSPPTADSSGVQGVISANHGHLATVTSAQLTGGNAIDLDIAGTANHTHSVSLTAAELDQIAGGAQVAATASTAGAIGGGIYDTGDAHNHTVTFN